MLKLPSFDKWNMYLRVKNEHQTNELNVCSILDWLKSIMLQ